MNHLLLGNMPWLLPPAYITGPCRQHSADVLGLVQAGLVRGGIRRGMKTVGPSLGTPIAWPALSLRRMGSRLFRLGQRLSLEEPGGVTFITSPIRPTPVGPVFTIHKNLCCNPATASGTWPPRLKVTELSLVCKRNCY